VVECENLAGVPNPEAVLSAAEKLLRPGGFLLVSGKSAHINRFFAGKSPFTRYGEKKHRGYRVVALKRL
jgi:2-polyprenyl-3-methyl-5-hydroxy-6-metoxy-1,4-benzoquinol methylase